MKLSKKLLAIALAVLMLAALATTAFAAETGSITVQNPIEDASYKAYKIFDVTIDGDNFAYTIEADSEWFEVVKAYEGITLTQPAGDPDTYVVEMNNKFNASDFAKALYAAVEGKTGIAFTDGKVTGLELGYYFVTSSAGTVCSLDTTNKDVTIIDKNEKPEITKEFDEGSDSVELGDIINYTIEGTVPNTLGYEAYLYRVSDVLSGADLNTDSIKVTIGGVDVTDKANISACAEGFKLDFDMTKYTEGAAIVITYSATVTSAALDAGEISNTATLTYSNDPTVNPYTDPENPYDPEDPFDPDDPNPEVPGTEPTPPVVVTSTIYCLAIDKVDGEDDTKKLAGAEFVLQNADGKYYTYDEAKDAVVWVEKIEDADVKITTADGAAEFCGIEAGDYKLYETKAPAGYNLPEKPFEVTVGGEEPTITETIANNAGAILPATGGFGTKMLLIVGTILFGATAIVLVTKKRMYNEG